jgi:predicted lipoprotein with Yx(FWY)xxD motif
VSAAAAGLLVLAACGSNGDPAAASGGSGMTVNVQDADGMSVLTTSSGSTLYTSDQEKGRILCTGDECTSVWTPLTVPADQQPTGSSAVAGDLGTIERQDGSQQVTFDGKPLYTFSFDHSAGQVNGNGQSDSFDGTDFTWHAATPEGTAPTSGSSGSSGSSGGSGYRY